MWHALCKLIIGAWCETTRTFDFSKVCDALELPFENKFDVVFSNAVFHWVHDHNALLNNVKKY